MSPYCSCPPGSFLRWEGDGPQESELPGALPHRGDVGLVALRRGEHAELAARSHVDRAAGDLGAGDTREVGLGLRARGADADDAALAGNALVADIDVVAAVRQQVPRIDPDRDVVGARGIRVQRLVAECHIVVAGGVREQRTRPIRRLVIAGRVGIERVVSGSGIAGPIGIGIQGAVADATLLLPEVFACSAW